MPAGNISPHINMFVSETVLFFIKVVKKNTHKIQFIYTVNAVSVKLVMFFLFFRCLFTMIFY